MASSVSSTSSSQPAYLISCCLLLLLLLSGFCTASRLGRMMNLDGSSTNPENSVPRRQTYQRSFHFQGEFFNFFPKGTRVPPSGPSKRHNSAVASTRN
uniref:Protein IDA-LIKE 4-like n=1 Tax=Nelumbo nucifera TaxID=4432 RepID=A0A822Z157_NELNU|nr:TPA_asm: hypothetical protein HUJ06_005858 [Nelumbo nucifera]